MTRRDDLRDVSVQGSTHPGLWMDKYLRRADPNEKGGDGTQKAIVIREAAGVGVPKGYVDAYILRKELFAKAGAACFDAEAEGRVAIGLGAKGVVENGITLEHTWGVPILPGSALKGLAAAAARKLVGGSDWSETGESYRELFGTTEASGCVDFHDAWWTPVEGASGLAPDVMTVHHAEYYRGDDVAPSDFDGPTPVPFCTAKGTFLVVLDGDPAWCSAAETLLNLGLEHLGIGAKTNAGYGRMSLGENLTRAAAERAAAETRAGVRRLLDDLKGPQNMGVVLAGLVRLRDAGLKSPSLDEAARELLAKDRKGWRDWRAKEKRSDGERTDYDTLLAPHDLAPPVPPVAPKAPVAPATPELSTREVEAWAEQDKRKRWEIVVKGEAGSYKEQAIEKDEGMLDRLKGARENPVRCVGHYDGKKLKKLSAKES